MTPSISAASVISPDLIETHRSSGSEQIDPPTFGIQLEVFRVVQQVRRVDPLQRSPKALKSAEYRSRVFDRWPED